MGDITTNDNVKFTILNLDQRLRPGPPVLTRIMVKFNRTTGSPKVRYIRLNGRKICPEDSSEFNINSLHQCDGSQPVGDAQNFLKPQNMKTLFNLFNKSR